jgi:hypothetical protein
VPDGLSADRQLVSGRVERHEELKSNPIGISEQDVPHTPRITYGRPLDVQRVQVFNPTIQFFCVIDAERQVVQSRPARVERVA